jgi:hypothetical protein
VNIDEETIKVPKGITHSSSQISMTAAIKKSRAGLFVGGDDRCQPGLIDTLSSQERLAHDPYAPFLRFAKKYLAPRAGMGCLY